MNENEFDSPRRHLRAYILAVSFWLFAMIIALKTGAVSDADAALIAEVRLPRAILATAVGMGLAVSGATLQALFSNPLCEPYTLGISSGSTLGAVLGMTLGFRLSMAGLTGSAFAGAMIFTGILYLISLRPGVTGLTLLLAGVMMGFLGSSLVALWMALADSAGIQGAVLWLMGDLSRARLSGALFSLADSILLVGLIWSRWRSLDALLLGEEAAASLGVPVASVRRRLLLLVSLLIGLCVSGSGMIGFIGLVVPHFLRRIFGSLHLHLLPLSAIWGATTLTLADALARSIVPPLELPVGVVTALIGAPLFIFLLTRKARAAVTTEATR